MVCGYLVLGLDGGAGERNDMFSFRQNCSTAHYLYCMHSQPSPIPEASDARIAQSLQFA